ncbi:MAG: cytochrome P450, partial [Stackebrandtia sp.]
MNDTASEILSRYFDPDPETLRDPHRAYTTLREHGDVHRVDHDGGRTWIVTGYDTAKRVLTDPRFSNDPGHRALDPHPADGARTMLSADPPEHTRLR